MAPRSIALCIAAAACASEESRQVPELPRSTAVHDGNFATRLPAHFAFLQGEHWFGIPAGDPQSPPGIDQAYGNWQLGTGACAPASNPKACVNVGSFGPQRMIASRYHPLAGIYSAAGGNASGQLSAESLARIDLMLSLVRRPCDQGARVDGFAMQLSGTMFTSLHPANQRAAAPELSLQAVKHFLSEAQANGMSPVMVGDDPTWYWNVGQKFNLINCAAATSPCVAAVQQDVIDMVTLANGSSASVKIGGLPVLWFFSDSAHPTPTDWDTIFGNARAQVGDFYAILSLRSDATNFADFFGRFDALSPWINLDQWDATSGATVHDHAVAYARLLHSKFLGAVPAGKVVIGQAGPGFDDFTLGQTATTCVERQIPRPTEAPPRDPGVLDGMTDYLAGDPRVRGVILATWDDWNEGSHLEPSVEEGTTKLELLRDKLQILFGDPADGADLALRQRWTNYGQARTCNFTVPVVPPPATVLTCTPPAASFTFSCAGRACNFDGSASRPGNGGPISSYAWSFGDGATGSGATTSHTYAANNTFTVVLTVTDAAGQTGSTSQPVQAMDSAPQASFSGGCTGLTCTFDAETSTASSGIASYTWTFGDGQTVSGGSGAQTVTHGYAHFGTFTVGLTVTDNAGRTGTTSQATTVTPGPTAAFSFSCNGLSCSFDASASSSNVAISTYHWWWDDETTTDTASATASHPYAFGGTFNVTLTVTDANGKSASVTHAVAVIDPNPVRAAFTFSCSGVTCTFDGSGSASNVGITSYHWWWDDETTTDTTSPMQQHVYSSAATFFVSLTVTDANGKTATATHPVTVVNPVAAFTFSCSGLACSVDASGSLSNAAITSYHWWWDDETTTDTTSAMATHTYAFAATFDVSLTVTDANGNTATATHAVSVSSAAPGPTAAFTFSCSGFSCAFDASGSSSNASISGYHWWWDDETTTDASVATAQHVYTFASTFNVSVTITDANGNTATATHPVVLSSAGGPVAAFVFSCNGLTCSVDASGSTGAIASYHWWWDDESTTDSATATSAHTYAFANVFNVSLTVTDSSGNSATVTHSVSAVSTAAGPQAAFVFGCRGRTCTFDGSGSASSVPIVHYHWWWDDETTTDLTGATALHVYGFTGTFVVTLTVTDANNQTASVSHAVATQ